MAKLLYGLIGDKIAIIDQDTSLKAKKECFKEKCTSVIVADQSDKLREAFVNEKSVTMDMFKGVVL